MDWLNQLQQFGSIRPIDARFGRFITEREDPSDVSLLLLTVLVSARLSNKHVCLDLADLAADDPFELQGRYREIHLPRLAPALQKLTTYQCIGSPTDTAKPMVLAGSKLYLQRYWRYEQDLSQTLLARAQAITPVNSEAARALFDQLFAVEQGDDIDWQKVACATALLKGFSVITGGPGTGKTTTVTKLLALVIALHRQSGNEGKLLIRLATPTGKAAARLSESIKGAKGRLGLDEQVQQLIPDEASTIHRLLGVKPHSSDFVHNRDNPLHVDVLVVDEVSMVDLPMMAKLMEALPGHCKVILLGDKDQLASVEAGSVLADICRGAGSKRQYQQAMLAQIDALCGDDLVSRLPTCEAAGFSDSICLLLKSHRFDDRSGIGLLAQAVNRGDWHGVKTLQDRQDPALHFAGITQADYQRLIEQAAAAYQPYLQMVKDRAPAREVIEAFNRFQLLCAVREGQYGVAGINQAVENQLVRMGLVDNSLHYYPGRPVMISVNDYSLQLFNGDVGLLLGDPQTGQLKAWFVTPDGEVKGVFPNRLPAHESVYAMTVHKSQGSEFEQVTLLLPEQSALGQNNIVTRELVYTGITRAKSRFNLYAQNPVLAQSLKQTTQRASGLGDWLYGE